MAFPFSALPVVVQWYVSDAWAAIPTNDVFGEGRSQVTITQGGTDETRPIEASHCEMMWRNTDGQYSPRNVTGDNYGLFGPNTKVRVGVTADDTWLQVDGPDQGSVGTTPAAGARVTAPDSAGLSITGDIDLRFDADLTSWHPDDAVDLVGKWTGTAGQKSYELVLQADGTLGMYWSNDGTAENGIRSTAPVPVPTGRLAVRATLDVDNGAGGHVVTFYTSTSIGGSWVQLGDAQTGSGTTSIFNSTTVATVLDTATGSQNRVIRGRVYAAKILDGIGGTERGNPDFTAQTAGASSFADAAGNTWTLTGAVELMDLDLAFTGEVPDWKPRRDGTGNDQWVPVSAFGELTRIQAGDAVVPSAMRRGIDSLSTVVGYWPLEDGSDATRFASGLSDGYAMTWQGDPSLATSTAFACSAALPGLNGSRWRGNVRPYVDTGEKLGQFLMFLPAGTPTNSIIYSLNAHGSRWDIIYTTGTSGSLTLSWFDGDGTLVGTSGAVNFGVDDQLLWVQLDLADNGTGVDYDLSTLAVGETVGLTTGATAASIQAGSVQHVRFNRAGQITSSSAIIGHAVVRDTIASLFDLSDQLNAYRGETAGARLARLCEENGVQFTWHGSLADTVVMGPQGQASLLTLLRECEATDHGVLHEMPDREGLGYRPLTTLMSQRAALTLDYTAHDLVAYEPEEGTVAVTNDVTAVRQAAGTSVVGSSARQVLESGPLSILAPPAGVGPGYAVTFPINVNADAQLPDHASWLLHVGTVDEQRVGRLGVFLQRTTAFATDAARGEVRALRVGDLVVVENPPSTLGAPDDLRQLVRGYSILLQQHRHEVEFSVHPASPYDGLVWDQAAATTSARYSSDGTTTTEALDTTETGVDVSTPTGPVWSHSDGDFDIVIGGEVMRVTAISGAGAAQTFTVTRSVNGVVKSHASGAEVRLARPYYWGL